MTFVRVRKVQNVADQLEKLPPELIERIISQLRLGDLVLLWQHASSYVRNAIVQSPAWHNIWPQNPNPLNNLLELYLDVVWPNEKTLAKLRRWARKYSWDEPVSPWHFDLLASELLPTQNDNLLLDIILHRVSLVLSLPSNNDDLLLTLSSYASEPDAQILEGVAWRAHLFFFNDPDILPPTIEVPDDLQIQRRIRNMKKLLDSYQNAQRTMNKVRKEQLLALARIYEARTHMLKTALAPQTERSNPNHTKKMLETYAKRVDSWFDLVRRPAGYPGKGKPFQGHFLFRYLHTVLVPYDWCLTLWLWVVDLCPALVDEAKSDEVAAVEIRKHSPASLSSETRRSIIVSDLGLVYCYQPCVMEECIVTATALADDSLIRFRHCAHNLSRTSKTQRLRICAGEPQTFFVDKKPPPNEYPVDPREIEWLDAFTQAVGWMQEAFPILAQKVLAEREAALQPVIAAERHDRTKRGLSYYGRKRRAIKEKKEELRAIRMAAHDSICLKPDLEPLQGESGEAQGFIN